MRAKRKVPWGLITKNNIKLNGKQHYINKVNNNLNQCNHNGYRSYATITAEWTKIPVKIPRLANHSVFTRGDQVWIWNPDRWNPQTPFLPPKIWTCNYKQISESNSAEQNKRAFTRKRLPSDTPGIQPQAYHFKDIDETVIIGRLRSLILSKNETTQLYDIETKTHYNTSGTQLNPYNSCQIFPNSSRKEGIFAVGEKTDTGEKRFVPFVEFYSAADRSWSSLPSTHGPPSRSNNLLYSISNFVYNFAAVGDMVQVWRYNLNNPGWFLKLSDQGIPARWGASVCKFGNKILLFGGETKTLSGVVNIFTKSKDDIICYDTERNKWIQVKTIGTPPPSLEGAGEVGGVAAVKGGGRPVTPGEIPKARVGASVTEIGEGEYLIIGGVSKGFYRRDMWKLKVRIEGQEEEVKKEQKEVEEKEEAEAQEKDKKKEEEKEKGKYRIK